MTVDAVMQLASEITEIVCRCCCACTNVIPRRMPRWISSEIGGPRCVGCELAQHFDSAKRASDAIRLHLLANHDQALHSWAAIRLSDGGTDGILYDTKAQAVRHQLHEYQCAYVFIPADGMSPRIAETFLRFHRHLYDSGFRLADPDVDLEVVMPNRRELYF